MSNLDKIFKAYILSRNKAPTQKYLRPENQYRLDEVIGMPEYCGLLDKDAVLVDVDSVEDGARLLEIIKAEGVKCRAHRTDDGYHFFFVGHHMNVTKTKKCSAVGIVTDWKLGTKNGLACLKLNNKDREVVYETEDIGELPAWLYPVKDTPVFITMGDGDGRNDTLYEYILTLQAEGLTKDEVRDTVRIINRYMLKTPLPEREVDTILRDEAFPSEPFYDAKGKLKVRQFEEHFMRECHGIKLDNNLHIYSNGKYAMGDSMIRGKMLEYLPDLTFSQRNEILNRSKDRIQTIGTRAPAYLIAFANGTYDLTTDTMKPHDPADIITNLVPWNYNPNAYCELTDKTLDKLACGDRSLRLLLEEMIGAGLYRSNTLAGGKCFILLGDNSNGKSTYFSLLRHIFSEENICSISLQDMSSRFKVAEMMNKTAIIGDDIPKTWVEDPSIFKKVVTGERLSAEMKGQNPFEFNPYCTPYFSANNMPRIDDETGAVKRRLIPVPFNAKFSPDDPDFDPDIKEKLMARESIEYLIRVAVEGLKRVRATNKYSINEEIESELQDIDMLNNPILQFLDDIGEEQIINHSTEEVYAIYNRYCIEAGMKPVARNSLARQINMRLGTNLVRRMVNKKTFKIFVK